MHKGGFYTLKLNKLIQIRKKTGYSQYEMAKRLSITQSYYCQLEMGKKNLYYDMAVKIAKIFNQKPDEIFYPENNEKES